MISGDNIVNKISHKCDYYSRTNIKVLLKQLHFVMLQNTRIFRKRADPLVLALKQMQVNFQSMKFETVRNAGYAGFFVALEVNPLHNKLSVGGGILSIIHSQELESKKKEDSMIKQPTSRTCFVCGRDNSLGLKMVWYNNPEENRIEAKVTIGEEFNGYPGIAHGGIVAAILDETSGRAVMLDGNFDNLFITLRLNMTYRKPTPTNTPLKVFGWLEHKGNRGMKVAAQLLLPDGTITAECKAVVVRPTGEISKSWEPEKKFWRVEED